MANKIIRETIEYVGILAKLEFTVRKKKRQSRIWKKCLDYIDT